MLCVIARGLAEAKNVKMIENLVPCGMLLFNAHADFFLKRISCNNPLNPSFRGQ